MLRSAGRQVEFVGAIRPWPGKCDAATSSRRWAVAAVAAACLLFSAPSASASEAGTGLDPVASAVPGHGRAWELVTPEEVISAAVFGVKEVAASGDRVAYSLQNPLADAEHGPIESHALATRGTTGWASAPVEYPLPGSVTISFLSNSGPVLFDRELTRSIWSNRIFPPDSAVGWALFVSQPAGGYRRVADMGETPTGLVAATPQFDRILFRSLNHLLPGDAARTEGSSLYEDEEGSLRLVDVDDGGALLSTCGSDSGQVPPSESASTDLSRVFFTARPGCGQFRRVYLRAGGHTEEISAAQCSAGCGGPDADVDLIGTTASGSQAFLVTTAQLSDEDTNAFQDVYRYDVGSGGLELLYDRPSGSSAAVGARVRSTDDGSRVYFRAKGQLIPGLGSKADDYDNLYLEDQAGLRFVAPVASSEFELTGDGSYVLFASATRLAPEDKDESLDLYSYDAQSGGTSLVSGGAGDRGNGAFDARFGASAERPGVGREVVFSTAEQLLPEDRNQALDVYEWAEGDLALVSAGTPSLRADFGAMTPDGGTVLFTTAATLLPRDRDGGNIDVYAARVGGGLPEPPAVPGADCRGEGCEPASAPSRRRPELPVASSRRRIVLGPIGRSTRRHLARRGQAVLLAEAPAPGRLLARGSARVSAKRRLVLTGVVEAKRAGPVRLRVRLTASGRRQLRSGSGLRVRLRLRMAGRRPLETSFALARGAP
jgi:hypothetical protein